MKSVGIKEDTHKELKKLTQIYEVDMGKFIADSVEYFKSTGINPADKSKSYTEELKNVKKEINRLIGFQKTFEKNHLFPLFESMLRIATQLNGVIPKEEGSLLATNTIVRGYLEQHLEKSANNTISTIQKTNQKIDNLQKDINDLKTTLSVILDHGAGTYTAAMGGHKTSIRESYNENKK